ncbi:S41 family peptidase [Arenimonas sp.]|jgi:carboxyl-terminal processing protease|uniref:S41 family peptidase n=1 Tax=Arenimonas sp. TaxID=1872635 RepID=UPI0037BE6D78
MKSFITILLLGITLPVAAQPEKPKAPPARTVPVDEIRRFTQVFEAVRESYVDALTDEEIMRAGLRGLLLDIDPHSSYLSAKQARDFEDLNEGGYAGIGIESDERDPTRIRVVAPFDDTPAQRAGLRAGDFITAINGIPVNNDHSSASPERLRGKPGTKAVLTVLRQGEKSPLTITVIREVISIQSVKARWMEPGYAYFRISAFQGDTGLEFRRQWQSLQTSAAGVKAKGVLLDLRSNPGGLVNAAVEVADAFLPAAVVVSTKGRNALANSVYYSKPGEQFEGVPVVVLIDAGSASASEILAGALQDHKRATIIGSRSFGKGSVQNVIRLDNGDAFKLTTSRYFTPNDRSIQAQGIVPDVLLSGNGRAEITERDLPKHIKASDSTEAGVDAESGVVLQGESYITKALVYLKQNRVKP